MKQGTVNLVGAGPGDSELITVAGLEILKRADVILYDRLVNPALLEYAPAGAKRIYVGKASAHSGLSQEAINELLIEYARRGKTVVRLKGGDPFVFGRGGEEAEACAAAGVVWRVIPGVSSAIGVPARAGIPVTHRGMASSLAVVTGHCQPAGKALDWAALARMDTLVILMGIENLVEIVSALAVNGKPCNTPVAIIENGTTSEERVITGRLMDIVDLARVEEIRAPAVIVVGEVVKLHEVLRYGDRINRESTRINIG